MERTTDYGITEAARRLGVTPGLLRRLETESRIPAARRDFDNCGRYGRRYSDTDLLLLRAIGVGKRPGKLRRVEDALREAAL